METISGQGIGHVGLVLLLVCLPFFVTERQGGPECTDRLGGWVIVLNQEHS